MVNLKYKKLYADVKDLKFATEESACMDICVYFGANSRTFTVYDKYNAEMKYMASQNIAEEPIHTIIKPGDRALLPTGIIFDIPKGYSVRIHPRSGLALKQGLSLNNCEGVVDSDFVNPVWISIINNSEKPIKIEHGDRIAQIELVQKLDYNVELIDYLPEIKTSRVGGAGSTGIK